MEIRYYGHSCFSLTSKEGVCVCTDPFTGVGYELPTGLTADIITVSHSHFDHSYISAIQTEKVISEAQECIYNGVRITGKESFHDEKQGALRGKNIIFTIEADGLKICHLGDLGEPYSREIQEKINDADVLLLPIGGRYTIDAAQAKEYVLNGNAKIIIPMHYKPADGELDIAPAQTFLNLFNEEEILRVPSGEISLSKKDVEGARKIIFMERIRK